MIPAYLVALGPFAVPALVAVLCGAHWLALWLLDKSGWRYWCRSAIVAGVALFAASLVVG